MAIPSDIDAIWPSGANSFLDSRLPRGTYCKGWNIVIRGGIPQTRPGSQWLVNFPIGKRQGAAIFEPVTGLPEVVAVIDGNAYVSQYPFDKVVPLPGLKFSADVDDIFIEAAEQSVRTNPDGSLTLITPRRVLILQDGVSAPGYYDGYNAEHIKGTDVTPQGTVMCWSGNRLWVARRNRLWASDYGNPFSFVEQFYLGGSDGLLLPGNATAAANVPNVESPILLFFTPEDTVAIQSGIPRAQWAATDNFQHVAFPGIGCVSHRAVATQAGWLYWYSQRGLQSLDLARTSLVSSTMLVADNEMMFSKDVMDRSLHKIALASFDNYLLVSVPYAGTRNRHTWVMDTANVQTLSGTGNVVWASVWTGFQPSDWLPLTIDGQARLFALSIRDKKHPEGWKYQKNSLIELFKRRRLDSGQDIECGIELRVMPAGTPTLKQLDFAYLSLSDVVGDVDVAVDWRGFERGQYKRVLTRRCRAAEGSFRRGELVEDIFALRGQFRRLKTAQIGAGYADEPGTSRDFEAPFKESWDWGFQFLVRWSGQAALRSFEPVYLPTEEGQAGECEASETEEAFSNFFGYDGNTLDSVAVPAPKYTETATFTGTARGVQATATATASSGVSAVAAVKMARQAAQAQVDITLRDTVPPVIGL